MNSFLAQGVGNSPIKKLLGGFARGGWSGLELTDTLVYLGREGGASGQYMNIHVDEKELVLEVRHYQGILMQIPKIK